MEYENSKRLEFMDMDGSRMMFKLQDDNRLEEWCDGKIEIKSVRDLQIDRETVRYEMTRTDYPNQSADRERVFEWFSTR